MVKKLFHKIPFIISTLFLLWCVLSFVDIAADNCTPTPAHSHANIFVLIGEGAIA
jgi:hypothetical protein